MVRFAGLAHKQPKEFVQKSTLKSNMSEEILQIKGKFLLRKKKKCSEMIQDLEFLRILRI